MSNVTVGPPSTSATIQDWAAYTEENHDVWRRLYERRMAELPAAASRVFLDGLRAIDLDTGQVGVIENELFAGIDRPIDLGVAGMEPLRISCCADGRP